MTLFQVILVLEEVTTTLRWAYTKMRTQFRMNHPSAIQPIQRVSQKTKCDRTKYKKMIQSHHHNTKKKTASSASKSSKKLRKRPRSRFLISREKLLLPFVIPQKRISKDQALKSEGFRIKATSPKTIRTVTKRTPKTT